MATVNPFDLLGDDDNDDPSQLIAAQQLKIEPKKPAQQAKPAKLPTKPVPPAQAASEATDLVGELVLEDVALRQHLISLAAATDPRGVLRRRRSVPDLVVSGGGGAGRTESPRRRPWRDCLPPPSHHPWPIGAPARPVEGHRAKRKPFEVKSTLIGVESSLVRSVSKQISHSHSPRRRLTIGSAFPTRSGRVSDEIGASFRQASEKEAPIRGSQGDSPPLCKIPATKVLMREAKGEGGRGRGRGGGRGFGRGRVGGGFNRDSSNNENSFSNSGFSGGQGATVEPDTGRPYERRGGYGGPRGSFRGGHRGGFNNGETGDGEPARRTFERHSGTGRSNEVKREGAGRGNWGTPTDEISQVTEEVVYEGEKAQGTEKPSVEDGATDINKENPDNEAEEKEPEAKEMTLEEYEKVLEEKRKALQALKTEERKVDVDKEFKSMQQLSNKKANDDIFVKLVKLTDTP
ncbi:hyaluronan [Actinidia rufa]|uniref:Hyaluronan n=1 Tax=Actinidia rufa TaxID=165716 RepID=A0A7J0EVA3_9ERIC|nr:hyaluronan [Actinidia rufa]